MSEPVAVHDPVRAFRLEPQYRERVWGGARLRAADPPIGEAWIAFALSRVAGGPAGGATVEALVEANPEGVLGMDVVARHGPQFPLLLKFLDTADWLSVQVHPNDAQAERLLGPGEWGKTEAWHVIEADAGAVVRLGVRSGTTAGELATAIRTGRVLDLLPFRELQPGETILVPARTLHTIGPGVLLYEVQQASDATFRAWDWERPQDEQRRLHIDEAVAVADVAAAPVVAPPPALAGTASTTVAACRYFRLDFVRVDDATLVADTESRSFHLLTCLRGRVSVEAGEERVVVGERQTVLIAGGVGRYRITALDPPADLMRASVPA